MDQRDTQVCNEYVDALEPLADAMVKRIIAATAEFGVERAFALWGRAFDLVFEQARERLFKELQCRGRL